MTHRPSSSPWTRTGGALLAAALMVPAAAAAWFLFTVVLPYEADRYRSYTAAVPCPAGSPSRPGEECVRAVTFTVSRTVVRHGGRGAKFRATLDGTPFWRGEVPFGDAGPVLEELEPGDRVDGTVWHGQVMRVQRNGETQATADEPRDESQFTAGVGTFAALLAVFAATLGVLQFIGRPCTVALARWIAFTTFLACAAPAVLAFSTGLPWWTVPAAAVPTALFAAEAARRLSAAQTPGGPRGVVDDRSPA
ncbi:hypothetical protein [Kitasatospora griseola]|uniref:hypothetical protein n=1 Tax=Kitasatospora griseola TaxID=2064 RepID=UPI00344A80F0